ncbi:hypothetical protein PHMEG_0002905 [Phytophthora megakarya]|uniref:Uncharacterized protein n=1 Tax=Phytophthora megakarya TaxID=4795 RepID=A0A225WZA9_9STRA|nr:hypothetical protein PHMEG_0002905 [Phytophthora megakarya]
MRTTIDLALVKGQPFVCHVQVYWRVFSFFLQLYWSTCFVWLGFDTRGLSILHFCRVKENFKRTRVRGSDMSNFSKKNMLPAASLATPFVGITGAVEVLRIITQNLCQPDVQNALESWSNFLCELRTTELPKTADALADPLFRVLVSEENRSGFTKLKDLFRVSQEAFVRVNLLTLPQDVLVTAKAAKINSFRMSHRLRGEGISKSKNRVVIPLKFVKYYLNKARNQFLIQFQTCYPA